MRLIAVPFDSGLRDVRMGRGPSALLDAGLADRLRDAGATVDTIFVEPPPGVPAAEIAVATALQRALSERVAEARRAGAFPVVLSGNCNSAIGTVGGMMAGGEPPPAVCWFDAHADLNTPETTVSGFLDGMALATLTGVCWRSLSRTVPGFRPVPAEQVVLVGARDVDPLEEEIVLASPIHSVRVSELAERLPDALGQVAARAAEVYVHVDLDVLDPSEGRANAYAAPGGLSLAALRSALLLVGRRMRVGAVAFTAYDPDCDPPRRIASAVAALAPLLVHGDVRAGDGA